MLRILKLSCALMFFAAPAAASCDSPAPSPVVNIPLPGRPFAVESSRDGCWLFVSLTNGAKTGIAVLHRDGGRIQLVRVASLKGNPLGMAVTHDGKSLIAASGASVFVLDIQRLTSGQGNPVAASLSDGANAGSVYANVTADDKLLFVSDESAMTITVIDLPHRNKIGAIPVGRAPIALTFSLDGRWLYTTSELARPEWSWPKACKPEAGNRTDIVNPEGAVVVIDVKRAASDPSQSVAAYVPAGCSPVRMAISPTGDRIYVTARNSNAVLAFDTAKLLGDPANARMGMATVGSAPVPLAVIDGGKSVIVGNSNRFAADSSTPQTLTVLDASRIAGGGDAVSGSVQAGAFPREMRLSPDQNTLFVTNFSSSSLQAIDLKRMPLNAK